MTAILFSCYLGRETISLERGLVVTACVLSVKPCSFDGSIGADFELHPIAILHASSITIDPHDPFEVGSVFLRDQDEVVSAYGYVSWTLVFNEAIKNRIMNDISEQASLYKKPRHILDEVFCADSKNSMVWITAFGLPLSKLGPWLDRIKFYASAQR